MRLLFVNIFILFSFITPLLAEEFVVPKINNFVNDHAGIIDGPSKNYLNRYLQNLKKQTGIELAVLTVNTTHGEPIEMASIKVTDKWQLGTAKEDKGLLLLIAHKDRRLRIEVGQGLEGDLTDAYSKRIIDNQIVPFFKKGQFSHGVVSGVTAMVEKVAPSFSHKGKQPNFAHTPEPKKSKWDLLLQIFMIIIFLIIRVTFFRNRWWFDGGFGGGSFGGGGGGGGSFGGGGGFSGGGSSGSW